jgi:hypothetical protein
MSSLNNFILSAKARLLQIPLKIFGGTFIIGGIFINDGIFIISGTFIIGGAFSLMVKKITFHFVYCQYHLPHYSSRI